MMDAKELKDAETITLDLRDLATCQFLFGNEAESVNRAAIEKQQSASLTVDSIDQETNTIWFRSE